MDPADLAAMRAEYADGVLDEESVGDDPVPVVLRWLDEAIAADLHEPNAVALATATSDGRPSVRLVLMKGFGPAGLTFFTNAESRKGRELAANPHAAVVLPWHALRRQVRIEGTVTRVDDSESDAYFASRPLGARLGAAASHQSEPIADRAALDARVAELAARGDVERPEWWGGFRLSLDVVELWQGRENRVHDRLRFTRVGDGWMRERLQP